MSSWDELCGQLSRLYGLREPQAPLRQLLNAWSGETLARAAQAAQDPAIRAASTNGETHFLRHPSQLAWLGQVWAPQQARRPSAEPTRILSAGCSTGEEVYSVAATVLPGLAGRRVEIIGVDINERALEVARSGHYRPWSLRGVSRSEVEGWLEIEGADVRVCEALRSRVSFRYHNLLEPWTGPRFDLILCRNVLIYFHPEAVARAWSNLASALACDGIIVCGPSDPGPEPATGLLPFWADQVRLYRKAESPSTPGPEPRARAYPISPAPASPTTTGTSDDRRAVGPAYPRESGVPAPGLESAAEPTPVESEAEAEFQTLQALLQQGHGNLAEAMLHEAVRRHPLHAGLSLLEAVLAFDQGRLEVATQAARRATFLDPEAPYPFFVLGSILERAQAPGAQTRYQWCSSLLEGLAPDDPLAYSGGLCAGQLREILDAHQ